MKKILQISFVLFCYSLASAEDSPTNNIQWYEYNIPPYQFSEGPRKGTGIGDPVKNLVIQKLTKFKNTFTTVSIPRMVITLGKKPIDTCIVGTILADEFRKDWLVTKPLFRESSPMLAMKQSTFDNLSKPSELSLENLLVSELLVFGRATNQYITPKLNSLIESYTDLNLFKISNEQTSLSLHRMLAYNRVDYIITYPAEAGWLKETVFKEEYDDLVLVKIKDLESQPPNVYAACTNTVQGKKVISELDELLTPQMIAQIHFRYMSWLPDDNSKIEFMAHQIQDSIDHTDLQ